MMIFTVWVDLGGVHWYLGIVIAGLVGLNTLFWGWAIEEVGQPIVSLKFLYTLLFNRWFILAMASGFSVSILSYWLYADMGVMLGRFFMTLSAIAIVIVGALILKESINIEQAVGMVLIILGALLIGRI
jgi:drug/metabolite transporter (DMT)-like permease